MALEYKRVRIKRFAQLEERETPESRFWRKFKQPVIEKQPAAVTSIDFNQQGPHDYVVTSGTRMVVYDGNTGREKRALTKFKETVYSGTWRKDGQMLCCGDARGIVRAIQPQTRSVLRSLKGHTAPVHSARFTSDGVHLVSCSDDTSLRLWDVPTGAATGTVEGAHTDYIRCSAVGADGTALAGVIATGSYDHTVKLWDSRVIGGSAKRAAGAGAAADEDDEDAVQDLGPADGEADEELDDDDGGAGGNDEEGSGSSSDDEDGSSDDSDDDEDASGSSSDDVSEEAAGEAEREHFGGRGAGAGSSSLARKRPRDGSILSVDHGEPVTSVTLLPSGGTLVTSGSNTVKVWDIVGGGRLVHTIASHAKLVTATCLDGSGSRLLSCGLDGLVKVHELATFTSVHTMRYGTPLLCLGIGNDNVRLVVGASDGGLHVRTRPVALGDALREKKEAAVLRGGTYRYFLRGATSAGTPAAGDDISGDRQRKPKLRSFDVLLKGFQHSAALDAALDTHEPLVVASVLQELLNRHALGQALAGRQPASAARIVKWTGDYVGHPRYAALCIDVASACADAFAPHLGTSADLDAAFARLATRTREETGLQAGLLGLQGCLDMLMAAASTGAGGAGLL